MKNENNLSIYKNSPLRTLEGIPVFSEHDAYVMNYQKIAEDHLEAIRPGADNPFIEDNLWVELESSTRSLIEKHVEKGAKILDVGVGLGRVIGPLEGYDRYGMDISFDYLKQAQERGIDICFSKIEDMPYEDAVFDAVVTCDVLEHVFDLNECCKNILRVLKPNGKLIIRVPFKEDLEVYLREDLPYEFIHLRAFDAASLQLQFVKIFKMDYIESSTVAPYLQGAPRLKLQLLPEEIRQKIADIISTTVPKHTWMDRIISFVCNKPLKKNPLEFLTDVTKVSSESLVNWIYNLRDNHKDEYQKLVENNLVHGIEINVVFKKTS